eukprot:CAMPEP_0113936028 /NCGR_PEP_ID=MMETSP1339-20121228/3033_1 /TAXON_ID=94617 /ORGANISM="Fibrocapsa japonica" /LENGTH=266 /DNA_ID=CAMNT_0000938361 /DNA_START=152 /DNA_END=949 /DNA_ORIENTATION=- /assembly_acc=CAM_ASM_000762
MMDPSGGTGGTPEAGTEMVANSGGDTTTPTEGQATSAAGSGTPSPPTATPAEGEAGLDQTSSSSTGAAGVEGPGAEGGEGASPQSQVLVKDPDAIKLFVGQVPKDMNEDALRPIFSEFGDIFDLMVIRDKSTGAHRGCAFLTYCQRASAEACVAQLHGQRKLVNAQNPLQVRPAEGQAERENKLFVGMVPKSADEDAIRQVFQGFGDIKEIHIIRNQDGSNKGCAFLKFMERGAAMNAIAELNEKFTMEGGPRPLVVKFADNKRGG